MSSWNHGRDKCKMTANSCGKENSNGVKCKGDHSRLLCGSGNAYCFAVYGSRSKSASVTHHTGSVGAPDDDFSCIDETANTVFYLQ